MGPSGTFQWLIDTVLGGALSVWILLDRDYRKESSIRDIEDQFEQVGIEGHIWRRKEIESYLLEVPLLARASGLDEVDVETALWSMTSQMYSTVYSRMLAEEQRRPENPHHSSERIIQDFDSWFQERWGELHWRLQRGPAKGILSALNRWIQNDRPDAKTVSARKLANGIRQEELASEMRERLSEIEDSL